MPYELGPVEARVLGALIEKDLATPEYYPLSLNALTNACNQKSNREPVMHFEDSTVRGALEWLRDAGLAAFVSEAGSRVLKFRHRLNDVLNPSRAELAVLAVLLLRGPQTGGELRTRTANLHQFVDLEAVQHTLDKLAARTPDPLARQLPRLPGTKEPRWCNLLTPVPEFVEAALGAVAIAPVSGGVGFKERIEQLEAQVEAQQTEIAVLRRDLDELRQALL